jgi:hypothetical protein
MPDDFRMARYKAMLNGRTPGPPREIERPPPSIKLKFQPKRPVYTPEEAARMLMKAVSMSEIHAAAEQLGLTFKEAYAERKRLYKERWGI